MRYFAPLREIDLAQKGILVHKYRVALSPARDGIFIIARKLKKSLKLRPERNVWTGNISLLSELRR